MPKKRYKNLDDVSNTKTFRELMKWMKERRTKTKDLVSQIPQAEEKEAEKLQRNRNLHSITWIGHSTFFIQLNGLNILTDPVWARRMGTGKRLTDPGIQLGHIPEIDIVLISHGHYDHLDFATIKKVKGDPTFYVPHGLRSAFLRRGYKNVIEANWWDSFDEQEVTMRFVPAQHWTKRTITDTNTSHWGGWVLNPGTSGKSIYFVGDTGYFRGFKEIAEKLSPQIILMPIGAYEPEWFMRDSHINPEDAVTAFAEMNGELFIPMHYGAYRLADDTGPEARERLLAEWERTNMDERKLKMLDIGETLWLE
ncbi:MBL fold metallo-hydrolase [Rossellomorea vietnamensis]|uniref:MBL fold metallo-hydrolase n=1 Tax=Rossellomorea vietnamensis TaxID=218284 RepID=A0A5D4NJ63_9BACI|nr:MBL fold metallo-hydrolase [Rossellomorea vietnamensis]TYS13784.1 MBL fold metallo-hydrolase [Rossellomorea vietnamensis]